MSPGRDASPAPPSVVRRSLLGEPGRLVGLDAARGFALVGMFVAHVAPTTGERIVDGRSSILFAVVAGMSVGLITARPTDDDRVLRPRLAIAIRGLALLLIGLALLLLRPPLAVILDTYGLGLLLLIPVLFAPRPLLAVLAVAAVVGGPFAVSALATVPTGGLPVVVLAEYWFVAGPYPLLVWIGYLLAGLLLARCDLRRRGTRLAMLLGGALAAALGYGAAALVPGVSAAAHSDTTAEALGSGGLAVAIVGGLLLAADLPGRVGDLVRLLLAPPAAAGAMPLTLYVAQVLVLAGFAAVNGGAIIPAEYPGWLLPALVVGALAFGLLWRALVGRGPLEAAVRALTRATRRLE